MNDLISEYQQYQEGGVEEEEDSEEYEEYEAEKKAMATSIGSKSTHSNRTQNQ